MHLALKDYVLLTANAGALICCNNKKVLADALHNTKTYQFSRVPDELLKQIAGGTGDFAGVDLLLYTHDHPDHYSKIWTQRCLERNENLQMVSPIHDFTDRANVHMITRPKEELQLAGIQIICKQIQHDGSKFASVRHYAYLLDISGYHILLLGDAIMDAAAISAVVDGWEVHLAILNFPFMTLKRGRDIMEQAICAQKYLFFHLPSLQDDINGYAASAGRTIQKVYQNNPAYKLLEEGKKEPIGFTEIE
jgi:hypothetical protein